MTRGSGPARSHADPISLRSPMHRIDRAKRLSYENCVGIYIAGQPRSSSQTAAGACGDSSDSSSHAPAALAMLATRAAACRCLSSSNAALWRAVSSSAPLQQGADAQAPMMRQKHKTPRRRASSMLSELQAEHMEAAHLKFPEFKAGDALEIKVSATILPVCMHANEALPPPIPRPQPTPRPRLFLSVCVSLRR